MKYLLDSNTCIVYLKHKFSPIRTKLDCLYEGDIVVCSVVKSELFYGAVKSKKSAENLGRRIITK